MKMICNRKGVLKQRPFSIIPGFTIRTMLPHDIGNWPKILCSAGEFDTVENAKVRFTNEFASQIDLFCSQTFVCVDEFSQLPVATATAWFDEIDPQMGRLHWVAVRKEYQGRGLARPLIERAVALLLTQYEKFYLKTQLSSVKAIGIYCDIGFVPVLETDEDQREWDTIQTILALRWS